LLPVGVLVVLFLRFGHAPLKYTKCARAYNDAPVQYMHPNTYYYNSKVFVCSVPCPSHFDASQAAQQCDLGICKGVGHVDCRGGEYPDANGNFLNPFGTAFLNAGRQWTTELCNQDSDGDGKTNGQELGDPCCVWTPGKPSPVPADYRISHPGHAKDVTDAQGPTEAECQALRESQGAAGAFNQQTWLDETFNEGEDRLNLTFRCACTRIASAVDKQWPAS
jgi:hypothetical protein